MLNIASNDFMQSKMINANYCGESILNVEVKMNSLINTELLVELRRNKGWNQKQLADVAGIDPSIVSRLERGIQQDLKVSVLIAICNALDVSTDQLLGIEKEVYLEPEIQALANDISHLTPEFRTQLIEIIRTYITNIPRKT